MQAVPWLRADELADQPLAAHAHAAFLRSRNRTQASNATCTGIDGVFRVTAPPADQGPSFSIANVPASCRLLAEAHRVLGIYSVSRHPTQPADSIMQAEARRKQ